MKELQERKKNQTQILAELTLGSSLLQLYLLWHLYYRQRLSIQPLLV
jgi:hypothetical protein